MLQSVFHLHNTSMFIDFISNAGLLITLSAFYGLFAKLRDRNTILFRVIIGVWFGFVSVAGMMMPFEYQTGAIFDGRSIVLTLVGIFGGVISAVISVLLSAIYRIYLGGPGLWAGLSTIILCASIGLILRKYYHSKNDKLLTLYGIGLLVHLIMLSCQLLFPWPAGLNIIKLIWFPVILIFPLAFVFIGFLLENEEKRYYSLKAITEAESLIRAALYSIDEGLITTDQKGNIQRMNREAEKLTGCKEEKIRGKKFDDEIEFIHEIHREKISPIMIVLQKGESFGLNNQVLLIPKSKREIPVIVSGAPILSDTNKIAGSVVIIRDQSEERFNQKLILKSESKYRKLVESTDAIAWVFDIGKNEWTYVAPQVTEKLEWLPKEWLQRDFWPAHIHPDDKERVLHCFNRCKTDAEPITLEYRFLAKTGEFHWIQDVISIETVKGNPFKMRGVMIDITARKKIEIELKEKNDFIQKVLDNLTIGVALNKIDEGKAFYMNQKFQEIYGWNAEDLTDIQSFFEKVYPDIEYRKQVYNRVISDIKTGIPENLHWEDIMVTKKDGTIAIVEAVNIPLFDQNIMVSTVMDVTTQKAAEKLLKESEERFRKIFETHSVVHLLIDPVKGDIINANQAASEFYGYSVDDLQQMKISQLNNRGMEEINEELVIIQQQKQARFEFKHKLADNTTRDVEVYSSIVVINGKEYLSSVIHDITDKKELFSEIVKAKEKAEENDRLKSAFLANMSHEIRTPLNGILGFTGILTEETYLSKNKRKTYSSIINQSAESLLQIINDILDLSRLETDQLTLNKRNFVINDLLANLFLLYRKKLDDKGKKEVIIDLLVQDESIALKNDENRLNQVFVNLLDNAVKFTQTGKISFGISDIKDEKIFFVVSDTGIGISKNKQDIIFERFAQAEIETSIKYGGSGLGLSIVRKLLKLMGGEITVESEPGAGTTFTFSLPFEGEIINAQRIDETENSTLKNKLAKKWHVLLVEDDKASIAYYQTILNIENIELHIASTGIKALELYKEKGADIILMDIRLPDINGLEIVKEIRKSDKKIKIIAQTAYAMPQDEIDAIKAGCNDYLSKPIKASLLLKKLNINF